MLPLELAGFWLGAGLVTWDLSLLLLGGCYSATRLLLGGCETVGQGWRRRLLGLHAHRGSHSSVNPCRHGSWQPTPRCRTPETRTVPTGRSIDHLNQSAVGSVYMISDVHIHPHLPKEGPLLRKAPDPITARRGSTTSAEDDLE